MLIKSLILSSVLVASTLTPCYAASQTDCGIWLCLPTGFPSGCGAEKAAFLHRMEHFKSPLPSFASCSVGSDSSEFTSQAPCIGWHRERHGFHYSRVCVRWRVQVYQNGNEYGQSYFFSS